MKSWLHPLAAFAGAIIAATLAGPAAFAAPAADCPNGGVVRFGVEPYDTSAKLVPIYDDIGKAIAAKLDCKVKIYITTNYNAEIEAMRNKKLEAGEFGPLGYVLAHQVAGAQAVAAFANKDGKPDTYWASIVTYPGSGIKTVAEIRGKSFAFADPASTSGHLFPAYALRKAGLQSRHRRARHLRRQPHLVLRGAVQPQGDGRRAQQRAVAIRDAARRVQARHVRVPVEVPADPDRSDRRTR